MNRYIIRKQRIAPGYLTRVEIIDEHEVTQERNDVIIAIAAVPINFLTLAPGEQLIIHNAGDN